MVFVRLINVSLINATLQQQEQDTGRTQPLLLGDLSRAVSLSGAGRESCRLETQVVFLIRFQLSVPAKKTGSH